MSTFSATGRFRGLGDLRLVCRQVYYEQLNFWLNPVGAVFTVGFSLVFLLLVGSSAGHSRSNTLPGDAELIQYYVPAFVAYGVMAACFNTLAVSVVVRRETGLLKRLRLSPLPTWAFLSSIVISYMIISAIQVVIVVVVGKLAYQVALPHNLLAFVVSLLVWAVSFTAVGIGASTLIPNQESGAPVTSVVFFVLLFLSGLWFPIGAHSGLAKFSSYFPVRHMILAVFASYGTGASSWSGNDLLVMGIWAVAGVFVAARRWSWAPRRARRGGTRRTVGFGVRGRR
jgi:ABC-2 type transport system permease protein